MEKLSADGRDERMEVRNFCEREKERARKGRRPRVWAFCMNGRMVIFNRIYKAASCINFGINIKRYIRFRSALYNRAVIKPSGEYFIM